MSGIIPDGHKPFARQYGLWAKAFDIFPKVQVAQSPSVAQAYVRMHQDLFPQTTTARRANLGLTVWHDGACPLCAREIALMRWLDRAGRIHFVDAADPSMACPLDRAAMLARLHAMEDGVMLSGAAAFAAMWRAIPVLRPRLQAWLR